MSGSPTCPKCGAEMIEMGRGVLDVVCSQCDYTEYEGDLEGPS